MPLDLDDTIAALASAPGAASRGIIRISGQQVADVVDSLFRPEEGSVHWKQTKVPRRFSGLLDVPTIPVPVPASLMFWPTNRSFTGQPMAEFHLIGSVPLLDAALEHLCNRGARLARRGEFTMRAFLAGRIDLLQAEAVLGVIEATDHEELQKALSQLGGSLTSRLGQLRLNLIAVLGDLEAGLDFVDEDIEFISREEIARRLAEGLELLRQLSEDSTSRLPGGYRRRIVLAGLPNAGKSTLFNRLTNSQKAIVSPTAGTTRDYITAPLTLDHIDIDLIDTAGWEVAADLIMERAQELRSEQVAASDLLIWCSGADLSPEEMVEDRRLFEQAKHSAPSLLHVMTRTDLANSTVPPDAGVMSTDLQICAETGEGIDELIAAVSRRLSHTGAARGELLGTTAVRCRDSLTRAILALQQGLEATEMHRGDEIISLEIRHALHELSTILGEVYTDDILDHIFSNFCIGK